MSISQSSKAVKAQLRSERERKNNLLKVIHSKQKDDQYMAEGGSVEDISKSRKEEAVKQEEPRYRGPPKKGPFRGAAAGKGKMMEGGRGGRGGGGGEGEGTGEEHVEIMYAEERPGKKKEMKGTVESLGEGVRQMGEQARGKLGEYRESAWERGGELKEAAQQKIGALRERTGETMEVIEERAHGLASAAGEKLGQTKEFIRQKAAGVGEGAQQVRERATDIKEEMGETLGEMGEDIGETMRGATATASGLATTAEARVRGIAGKAKESLEQAQSTVHERVYDVKEKYDNMLEDYNRFKIEAAQGHGYSLMDKAATAVSDFSSWVSGGFKQPSSFEEYDEEEYDEEEEEEEEPEEVAERGVEALSMSEEEDEGFVPEIIRRKHH